MQSHLTKIGIIIWIVCSSVVALAQTAPPLSDEPITAQLAQAGEEVRYTVSVTENERITLTLASRDFDPLLTIVDENGTAIAQNDDSDGSLNSRIDNFQFNQAGDYRVIVASADQQGTGEYTLTLIRSSAEPIAYGDIIQGELTDEHPEILYQFEGQQGDVITARMMSDDFDSFLVLSNQEEELFTDDDSGGSLDALIVAYTLPETGIYTLRASSFSFSVNGNFSLMLDTVDLIPVELNQPVTVNIEGRPMHFAFDAKIGDTISVRVRSKDGLVDTALNLIESLGYSLAFDDDGGYIYDPEINDIIIYENGQYIAILLPNSVQTIGEVELTVSNGNPTLLECGTSQTLSFTDKIVQVPFIMDVTSGQQIRFIIYGDQNALDDLTFSMLMDGEYMTQEYQWNVAGQMTVVTDIETDGELQMIVGTYTYSLQNYPMDIICTQ